MDPATIGLICVTVTTLITNIYQITSNRHFHSECSNCMTIDYETDQKAPESDAVQIVKELTKKDEPVK